MSQLAQRGLGSGAGGTVQELVVWSFRKNNKLIVEVHSWSPDVGC